MTGSAQGSYHAKNAIATAVTETKKASCLMPMVLLCRNNEELLLPRPRRCANRALKNRTSPTTWANQARGYLVSHGQLGWTKPEKNIYRVFAWSLDFDQILTSGRGRSEGRRRRSLFQIRRCCSGLWLWSQEGLFSTQFQASDFGSGLRFRLEVWGRVYVRALFTGTSKMSLQIVLMTLPLSLLSVISSGTCWEFIKSHPTCATTCLWTHAPP